MVKRKKKARKRKRFPDPINLYCQECDQESEFWEEEKNPAEFIVHFENVEVHYTASNKNEVDMGLDANSPELEFDCWGGSTPDHLECARCGTTYSDSEVLIYSEKQHKLAKRREAYAKRKKKTKRTAKRVSGSKRR